jgi:hypothetical protein
VRGAGRRRDGGCLAFRATKVRVGHVVDTSDEGQAQAADKDVKSQDPLGLEQQCPSVQQKYRLRRSVLARTCDEPHLVLLAPLWTRTAHVVPLRMVRCRFPKLRYG